MGDTGNAGVVLPWPAEWSAARRSVKGALLGGGFIGILALATVWAGILGLFYGEREPALLTIAVGVYLGTGAALVLWARSSRRRMSSWSVAHQATGIGGGGTVIFYSRGMHYLLATAVFATFVLMTSIAIGGFLEGEAVIGGVEVNLVDTVAFGSVAIVCLWISIGLARGLIGERRPRLVLSPDGIRHRSYTFEHFVPWDAVFSISAADFRGPVIVARALESKEIWMRRTIWAFMQDEPRYAPDLRVRSRLLAVDPAVAYYALRYYHAHPESRMELLASAGRRRIQSGNLLG